MKNVILFVILSSSTAFSQNGFLGKKNVIDLTATGNIPVISGSLREKEYRPKGTEMVQRKDWLDYGLSLNYLHYTRKGRSFGLKSAVKYSSLSMPAYYLTPHYIGYTRYNDTTHLRFEPVRYAKFYFAPSFEFTTKKGFAGVGLSYDFAAGICLSFLDNASYAYSINEFDGASNANWSETDYITTDYKWPYVSSLFVQTGFKLRYPLNDRFLFYSGFHYTAMLSMKPDLFEKNYNLEDIYRNEDLYYQIQREDLFTVNLDLGISFTF
ncbi:MAG: hypothetical protein K0R65_2715 [Crocinitomicaceae bacterium]|jgi:hypothetical protein|nr:hypothetical protein [Crocinitomicaceae bacterium]